MGYIGFSMSERAAGAYDNGMLPAGKLAKKLGVSAAAVKAVLPEQEWHHTSSRYNRTGFYSFGQETDCEPACISLRKMREFDAAHKPEAAKAETFRAVVTWLEWGGTRNHPHATECKCEATVSLKGKCYTITKDNGFSFRKFAGTRGFSVRKI